jgi:hypothetical protein
MRLHIPTVAPAQKIAKPVRSIVYPTWEQRLALESVYLAQKDDAHDKAVDGDDFAEDDGQKVLGPYSKSLDVTAKNWGTDDENTSRGGRKLELIRGTHDYWYSWIHHYIYEYLNYGYVTGFMNFF